MSGLSSSSVMKTKVSLVQSCPGQPHQRVADPPEFLGSSSAINSSETEPGDFWEPKTGPLLPLPELAQQHNDRREQPLQTCVLRLSCQHWLRRGGRMLQRGPGRERGSLCQPVGSKSSSCYLPSAPNEAFSPFTKNKAPIAGKDQPAFPLDACLLW